MFKLLDAANLKAVEALERLSTITGSDPPEGDDVELLPCRFRIDGHLYGAFVTEQQRDRIRAAICEGTAKHVLEVVAFDIICNHLYAAANQMYTILEAALKFQPLSGVTAPPAGLKGAVPAALTGGCQFKDGNCQPNCSPPLCKTLGGTPCGTCETGGGEGGMGGGKKPTGPKPVTPQPCPEPPATEA